MPSVKSDRIEFGWLLYADTEKLICDFCLIRNYSPEQSFDVVAAVDLYHGFIPWCQRSDIVKLYPDGSFDAELEIGFKFLVDSYVSCMELNRPKFVKVTLALLIACFLFCFQWFNDLMISAYQCFIVLRCSVFRIDAWKFCNVLNVQIQIPISCVASYISKMSERMNITCML